MANAGELYIKPPESLVIGVTGKYCSGKDTAVSFFKERGFTEINADKIGHQVLEKKKSEVTS